MSGRANISSSISFLWRKPRWNARCTGFVTSEIRVEHGQVPPAMVDGEPA